MIELAVSDLFLLLNFDDLRQHMHSPVNENRMPLVTMVMQAIILNTIDSADVLILSSTRLTTSAPLTTVFPDEDVVLHAMTSNSH